MKRKLYKLPEKPDFEIILRAARDLEHSCSCCERHCGIDRSVSANGFCGVSSEPILTKFFITYGEEPFLTPARMVYAAGCNLRCAYCSNDEFIRGGAVGKPFDFEGMAGKIDMDFRSGRIHCVQFLGGEPSCWLSGAVHLASLLRSDVPIVWNSNFCFTGKTFEILRKFVDFYVADFKFGNRNCAAKLSQFSPYVEIVKRNLLSSDHERLLIRHLPLHGHLECCTRPVLQWIAEHLPDVPVNFNELLPDSRGVCRRLEEGEWNSIAEMVGKYGIRRNSSIAEDTLAGDMESPRFSGEIQIRADGTVAIQDFASPLRELMKNMKIYSIKEKDHDK